MKSNGLSDPYKNCPVFETPTLSLRLVSKNDAEDLLTCYSDSKAQDIFNADRCTSDFRYTTAEEMTNCINYWLDAYRQKSYIRFSIVDKAAQKPIGTVEMFGAPGLVKRQDRGVLRIDIASRYETQEHISELLTLADKQFFKLFNVECIVTKAIPIAKKRIEALLLAGYTSFEWEPGREHYYVKRFR